MITISLIILELFLSVGIFGIDIVINITNIAIIIESKASSFINFIMSILTLGFAHCSLLPPHWPPQRSLWTENSFITSNCRRMLMMMMVMMRVVAMMVIILLMMVIMLLTMMIIMTMLTWSMSILNIAGVPSPRLSSLWRKIIAMLAHSLIIYISYS